MNAEQREERFVLLLANSNTHKYLADTHIIPFMVLKRGSLTRNSSSVLATEYPPEICINQIISMIAKKKSTNYDDNINRKYELKNDCNCSSYSENAKC